MIQLLYMDIRDGSLIGEEEYQKELEYAICSSRLRSFRVFFHRIPDNIIFTKKQIRNQQLNPSDRRSPLGIFRADKLALLGTRKPCPCGSGKIFRVCCYETNKRIKALKRYSETQKGD